MGDKISKLASRAKDTSVFIKLTLSYMVLILLLASAIGFTSYYLSSSNYNNEVIKLNQQLLEQYSGTIQETLISKTEETRRNIAVDVSLRTDIDILFENQLNLGEIKTLQEELETLTSTSNSLYQGIHVYSKRNNIILSSIMGLKYLDDINPLSSSNLDWINKLPNMKASVFWMPAVRAAYTATGVNTNVISCIMAYPSNFSFENAWGYIKIDINQNYLMSVMKNIDIGGKGKLFLIDNSGNVLSHSDNVNIPSTVLDLGYPSMEIFEDDSLNNTRLVVNGIDTIVSYVSIGDTWILVRSIPVDDFYSVSKKIALYTIIICLLVVFGAMIIGRIFASNIYSPLKLLTGKVKYLISSSGNKKNINEYSIIDDALSSYNSQLLDLNQKWEDNMVTLKQNLLRSITGNTINSAEDFDKRLKLIGRKDIGGYYNLMLVYLVGTELNELLSKEQDKIINSIVEYIESINSSETLFIPGQITSESIASLIISKNPNLENVFKEIIAYASNTLGVDIDISFGIWRESILDSYDCYLQAVGAYRYKFFMPRQNIFDFGVLQFQEKPENQNIANKMFTKFANDLVSDNDTSALAQIQVFIEFIATCDFPIQQRFECLQNITMVLSNYSKEYYIGESDIDLSFHYMQYRFADIYEYETWLTQATYHILELKKNQSDRKVDDIIYNIKRYISENLANDLSLTRLSEYTTLSNCYLSHVFKESTGVNVVDYITEQRMMRAKSLLETTSINIELVAASCGYGTPHYFSKKFKQYFGLTPRSYRIAYGEKQLGS